MIPHSDKDREGGDSASDNYELSLHHCDLHEIQYQGGKV
jgi:hypothetical protein